MLHSTPPAVHVNVAPAGPRSFALELIAAVPAPDCGRLCCGCPAPADATPDDLRLACADCWSEYAARRREQGGDWEADHEEYLEVEAHLRAHMPRDRELDSY